jgi:hypothetical protein
MSMLRLLLLPFLQTAPVTPPPPPITPPAPPASPAYSAPIASRYGAMPVERFTVDVEVKAGGELLWSGALRVSSANQTSFRREIVEAPIEPCTTTDYGIGAAQSSLNLTLQAQRGTDMLSVSTRWGRPGDSGCGPRGSTRTVELSDNIKLTPGRWSELQGDGGLVVRVRRR